MDLYDFNASPETYSELIIHAEDLMPRAASGSGAAKFHKVELLLRSLPNAVNLVKLEIHGLDHRDGEIENDYWGDNERQRLADTLKTSLLPRLYHLSIVSSLGVGEKAAAMLAPALSTLTGLQHLDLSHNCLGPKGATLLTPALERLTSLQFLDLSHAGLGYGTVDGGSQGKFKPEANFLGLRALLELRSLNLSGNYLGVNGTSNLAHTAMHKPLKYLQHLNLSNNAMGAEGAAKLAPALKSFGNSLQHLNLSDNGMGPGGLAWLGLGLKDLSNSLQHLDLSDNTMGAEGVASLEPALKDLVNSLRHLKLGGNSMGDEGAAVLAPVLRSLTNLQHLDLGENGMGWEGAAALAPAVKSLRSMLHLDLGGNFGCEEEAEGIAIMAPAIKALYSLQHLDVSNTGLGYAAGGAAVLAPALGALRNLKHLNLRSNDLGVVGIIALLTPALDLFSLRHLDLSENGLAKFEDWPGGKGVGIGSGLGSGLEGAWVASLKKGGLKSLKYLKLDNGLLTLN